MIRWHPVLLCFVALFGALALPQDVLRSAAYAQAVVAPAVADVDDVAAPVDPPVQMAQEIDDLIAGQLDIAVAPETLLSLPLTGGGATIQLLDRLVNDGPFFTQASADPALLEPLADGEAALMLARARFLRLPEAQRDAALAAHRQRVEAALVAETQESRASQQIRSEQARLVARERVRLQAVRKVQAGLRSEINAMVRTPADIADAALGWRRRVNELAATSGRDRAERAGALYDRLVIDLRDVRARLNQLLSLGDEPDVAGFDPPGLDAALPLNARETRELSAEQRALARDAAQLRADYADTLRAERQALREAMIAQNDQRLALVPLVGPSKRSELLGFGGAGIAQAQREATQIYLDLRYHLHEWRTFSVNALDSFLHPTPDLVFGLLRLVLIGLVFRWWRKVGDRVLARSQVALEAVRPQTLLSDLQARAIHYIRRVRRPLDWLILALVVRWLLPEDLAFAGIDLIWIIIFWSLVAILLVRLADALASGMSRDDPRAELRWHSLRLVAASLLSVGLLLALTSASVGRGTIYSWVLTLCWLIAPAIILILAHWWRERIVALAETQANNSALLAWVSRDPGGLAGLLGRVAAGAVVLIGGLQSVIANRAGDIALIRELFEQHARSRAAQRVAQDKASGRFHRLPAELQAELDPHRLPLQSRIDASRPGGIVLPDVKPGTLTLVVGERGMGKSAFLRDLGEKWSVAGRTLSLQTAPGSFDVLLATLARALGLPDGEAVTPEAVARALAAADTPLLITVDDVHRLAVPAIGGLAPLDRLVDFARHEGGNCAWAFSIGGPAWNYVARARSDRALFDMTVRLPRWPVAELQALIERRTEQAGIAPDFSDMIDEGALRFRGEMDADKRRKMGYFERLADYADGNPAIALEYWRRSLFIDGTVNAVSVRTFATPDVARLTALPAPAMFVLRAIVQMDLADAQTINRSTDLPADVVFDALRGMERIGTIMTVDGSYQVTIFWWMEVMRLLKRQNLIVRDAA